MASPSVASRSKQSARAAAATDDVIMARALEFSAWAKRNARIVIATTAVAAVVLGGLAYYYLYHQPRAVERASIQLMQVERNVESGNATLAERDLTDFIRRFDGTPQADEARMMLARQYLEAGNAKKAIPVLQAVDQDLDTPVGAQARLLLASAQGQSGDREAAVRTYLAVADGSRTEFYQREALSDAAVLQQEAGNFSGAADLWRRLVETTEEGSAERTVYEMRLAEAEGRAQAK